MLNENSNVILITSSAGFIGSIIIVFTALLVIFLQFNLDLLTRLNNFCPIWS